MITPKKKRLNKEANLVRRAMSVNGTVRAGSDVHEAVKLAVLAERKAIIALLNHHAKIARDTNTEVPLGVLLDVAIMHIETEKHLKS